MRVYLDNNILVSIEENEISIESFLSSNESIIYVYSYVHIQELLEAKKDSEKLKLMRIKTISDLTNNKYLYPDNNKIALKTEAPEKVILTLEAFGSLTEIFRKAVLDYNIDRNNLIRILEIDEKRINNYSAAEVLDYINDILKRKLLIGFNSLIELSGASLREKISTLFNLLDFIGFWKDKKDERSNLARAFDSSHAYFASNCDQFVSNDKRARCKTKVAYLLYGINTQVLSLEEFLGHFNKNHNCTNRQDFKGNLNKA